MPISRRHLLEGAAVLAAGATVGRAAVAAGRYDAVAFDAFPVFDPRPVAAAAERAFPGRGGDLVALWRRRQFEYAWLRVLSRRYLDFEAVTADALDHAVEALGLDAGAALRASLVAAFSALPAWPDSKPALTALRRAGLRLGFVSNLTDGMLTGSLATSGLAGLFDAVVSTDRARTYKPDPNAYALAVEAFGVPKERILFAAFAGWDAAGAASFGFPTVWVNRLGAPPERLGATPIMTGPDLATLVEAATR